MAAGLADPARELSWREDATLSGNNILMMGIYYEALRRWIGSAQSVVAQAKTVVPTRPSGGIRVAVTVPDWSAAVARYASARCFARVLMQCAARLGAASAAWTCCARWRAVRMRTCTSAASPATRRRRRGATSRCTAPMARCIWTSIPTRCQWPRASPAASFSPSRLQRARRDGGASRRSSSGPSGASRCRMRRALGSAPAAMLRPLTACMADVRVCAQRRGAGAPDHLRGWRTLHGVHGCGAAEQAVGSSRVYSAVLVRVRQRLRRSIR